MYSIGGRKVDTLEELFSEDGCGYLDEEPSEPCSPGSLTPSLIEELESSVSKADSKNIAVAFASIARKSTAKGQPTILSMRLVPKSQTAPGGLAVSTQDDHNKKESRGVYNRFSVVGPIDLADPDEVAKHMARNSQNAYLVTECHPGPNLDDFASMDTDMQSDLLWNWSVFREEGGSNDTAAKPNSTHDTVANKEHLLG